MLALRAGVANFVLQSYYVYRALFTWIQPPVYVSNAIVRPAMQVVLFYMLGRFSRNEDTIRFYLVGMIAYASPLMIVGAISNSLIGDRSWGTLPYLFVSSTNRVLSYFSRGAVHVFNGLLCSAVALTMVAILEPSVVARANWPAAVAGMVLVSVSVMTYSLLLGGFILVVRDWNTFYTSNQAILLALTGVALPLNWIPEQIRWLGQILPITHAVQAMRAAFAGATFADCAPQLGLELAVAAGYAIAGVVLFQVLERHSRKTAGFDIVDV